MAMRLTGQRGYYTAEQEYHRFGGAATVNQLIHRLGYERYAAFIRGYLIYLFDHRMIDSEDAENVMWTIRREHWLAGFPQAMRYGHRPYGL